MPAGNEAGEEVHWPAAFPKPARLDGLNLGLGVDLGLATLHSLPKRLVDDAEFGDRGYNPRLRGVQPR
jgi:hypothetical protein